MYVERHVVDITTDGSGNGTGYSGVTSGRVLSISYVKDGTTPYSNGVDFAVTAEATTEAIWTGTDVNATTTVYPRAATHSTVGAAALYAAVGTAVNDAVAIGADRVKISVSSGGASKVGRFHVIIG